MVKILEFLMINFRLVVTKV